MDMSHLPIPDGTQPIFQQLTEALVLEDKYRAKLDLPVSPTTTDDVTIANRDSSAHVLRCLKVWYDLPTDVLIVAINLMDRFLAKMKVKIKHMACVSVSSFYVSAMEMFGRALDPDHLVSVSQCKCTSGDLKRMSELIKIKLDCPPGSKPVNSLLFLRLFNQIFHAVARQIGLGDLYERLVSEPELCLRLEMVACNGDCASLRPSEVAFVLICTWINSIAEKILNSDKMDSDKPGETSSEFSSVTNEQRASVQQLLDVFAGYGDQLKAFCKISDETFFSARQLIGSILQKYNDEEQSPHRQRLVWRLSSRTVRLLKPTNRFTSNLPAIAEHGSTSPKRIRKNRKYSRRHGRQGQKKR